METELYLPKMEHSVWFLKVDSFLLHSTSLWTPVSASSAESQGVQMGFWIRVATFNGTLWFNWEFSALWLEDVKVALSERHKGPMYRIRLMRGRIWIVPGMYQPGSPSGLELTVTLEMENKLSHTHTHTPNLQPKSSTGLLQEIFIRVLEPILLDPPLCIPSWPSIPSPKMQKGKPSKWPKDIPSLIKQMSLGFQTRWNLCQRCLCFYIWGPLLPHTFSWLPSNQESPTEHAHWKT